MPGIIYLSQIKLSSILNQEFFSGYTPKVAKNLLGCFLMREVDGKIYKGLITETECYRGRHDLACHAAKGKTERTKVMFGEPGRAYVYLVYGVHWMLNAVTEAEGYPAAVLIRGAELRDAQNEIVKKLDGPGKLTRGLKIGRSFNEWDLTAGEKLWIEGGGDFKKRKIIKKPRVGVDYARHCKNWKWNFRLR
ncbi:MAG: DNA-3-methyladenine glycosylase [Candidatus Moranbacteria bacterium]|nr:DNA-3-methyladenine glycosylase [Candidatus Moranbacteria bacterium]